MPLSASKTIEQERRRLPSGRRRVEAIGAAKCSEFPWGKAKSRASGGHAVRKEKLMLTLVHAPRSRSLSCLWLLEEIGEPYDIQYVSIRRGDGSGALDPANPHPHGKVPVLKDGESTVFEQTAIALYLADKFPGARLGPAIDDPARGAFLTMLAYYTGVIEPAFTSK